MTRFEKRQQRDAVRADRAAGMRTADLMIKYQLSKYSVIRAMMSEEKYQHHINQIGERKDRAERRKKLEQGDLLLKRLFEVHGEPRNEIAKELQNMRVG